MNRRRRNNIFAFDPHRPPFLSIIIPAFNEERRLPETLKRIVAYIETQSYAAEVIAVDNASTDRTKNIIMDFSTTHPFIRYRYEAVRGKGAAVRTGILSGQGEYLLLCDADLAVPIEEIKKFLPPEVDDYDIAIGSREIEGARRYGEPFYRHLMGRVFNIIVRFLILPGLHDTQCGFKCFKLGVAHDLFRSNRIDGWSFDVEILSIARIRGYRIIEVPVNWYYGEKSKVNPLRDTLSMVKEIIAIRKNIRDLRKERKSGGE